MEDELQLTVRWKSVRDFMTCPVCMCHMSNTFVTPCGHRYCQKCITECIDRHQKCPCCNRLLRKEELIRDHQFDDLIRVAVDERDKSEKNYFDNLIDSAGDMGQPQKRESLHRVLSPVETVLKKHLKGCLSAHEHYYQDLKSVTLKKKDLLEADYARRIEATQKPNNKDTDSSVEAQQLRDELHNRLSTLDEEFLRCGEMVGQAFDKYLSEHIPSLSILPVTVSISLLNKGLQISDIDMKPHDSVEDIKGVLRRHMEALGDKIVEFGPDVKFLCFGPLSKRTLYERHRMAQDIVELGATHHDIFILSAHTRPILEHQMKPGSDIAVYGKVLCKSDLPKVCFAKSFKADEGLRVDYFSCRDCKMNWVCRSCMDVCHKDHQISPYIMNHQPTWACCYCPKKKKCTIVDK